MKYQDHQLLEEAYDGILSKEKMQPPANWDTGFEFPYQIGSGGTETPFIKNGKWYIYIWNSKTNKHFVYSYSDDIFYPDTDFQ